MSDWIWALIIGFVLDLLLGDPAWLYHPVCIIGKYIGWMEKKLRRRGGNLRKSAVFLTASTVLLTMAVVALILMLCGLLGRIPLLITMALLDWMGIAITSMAKEARGVEKALGQGARHGKGGVPLLLACQLPAHRREVRQNGVQLLLHPLCHPDAAVGQVNFTVVLLYDHALLHEQVQNAHHRGFCHPQLFRNAAGADVQVGARDLIDRQQIAQMCRRQFHADHSLF